MSTLHRYETSVCWRGNRGTGTSSYRACDRAFETTAAGRPTLSGSADPAFRGDAASWNPELLLVAALSQCHLLSYLHRCAIDGVVVCDYRDDASGVMAEDADSGGRFTEVVLRPQVLVSSPQMVARAVALHDAAADLCFLASSVNFPVGHEPDVRVTR
jgi:organic hydroperoxide reductase OsmC/OhrA